MWNDRRENKSCEDDRCAQEIRGDYGPNHVAAQKPKSRAVRNTLDRAMQNHCACDRQYRHEDSHKNHAASHSDNAGQDRSQQYTEQNQNRHGTTQISMPRTTLILHLSMRKANNWNIRQ